MTAAGASDDSSSISLIARRLNSIREDNLDTDAFPGGQDQLPAVECVGRFAEHRFRTRPGPPRGGMNPIANTEVWHDALTYLNSPMSVTDRVECRKWIGFRAAARREAAREADGAGRGPSILAPRHLLSRSPIPYS